jgi:NTE family protein
LGIAHLGVLKVMEEAGLRPDCITGVSMGSVIGGFYAIGYSSDSILKILKSENLAGVITNKIDEDRIIYLEKNNFRNSIISIPVSIKKVNLPSGVSNGQVIEKFLSFYLWPAAGINDFSKLPIPFTCVGADILTARAVDLKKGYLPDALRASLAIPSLFTPIKIDSALLLDGGIYRNFATQEAVEMGADIIIGSYTGHRWKEENELDNVADILKQISFSLSYDDFEQQKKLANYLIIPQLKGLSSMDFSRVDSIYQRGYAAALPFKEKFIRLADSLNKFGPQKPIENILGREYYSFDRISIRGNNNYSDRQVMGILDIQSGDTISKFMLMEKTDLLYGKNWFEKVKYRIKPENDSLILEIECIEKPAAMLYGSLHYDNAIGSGALLAFSSKNYIFPGSVININTFLGNYYRIQSLFLQYLGWKQHWSASVNVNYDKTPVPVLHIHNETGNVILGNLSAALTLSKRIGLNHMLDISGIYEYLNLTPRYVSASGLDNISYNYIKPTVHYGINTLDTKYFPNKGTTFDIMGNTSQLISASIRTNTDKMNYDIGEKGDFSFERFYTLKGSFRQYFSKARNVTFSVHADAVYLSRCDSAVAQNNFYLLGGLQSISNRSIAMTGFHTSELPVKIATGAGIEIDIEVLNDFHLSLETDIFAAQSIYMNKGYNLLAGFGLGAGYMTILGPVKVGMMYGRDPYNNYFNNFKGYLSIGFNF